MNKAINNIVANIEHINEPYSQAIVAYALRLADHPMQDEVLDNLVGKSMSKGKRRSYKPSKYFRINRLMSSIRSTQMVDNGETE